jgi:hypothetical protein
MSKSRTQVEEGWIPPHMYGGYWIRLMINIDSGEDPLAHSVYEAADAVNQFAKAAGSGA